MDSGDRTLKEEMRGHAFKELFEDHYVALLSVSICTLVLGSPLEWNLLWHLRVRISNCQERKYHLLLSFPHVRLKDINMLLDYLKSCNYVKKSMSEINFPIRFPFFFLSGSNQ